MPKTLVSFSFNGHRTRRTLNLLSSLAENGPKEIAIALQQGAFLWHGEIVKHTPVAEGLLRASWAIATANTGGDIVSASVGTNVPYAVFIEFGTRWIAQGAVLAWGSDQGPILDWEAKRSGQKKFDNLHGAAKKAHEDKVARDQAAGREEFMPPMRASWNLVEEKVQVIFRNRLRDLMMRGVRAA